MRKRILCFGMAMICVAALWAGGLAENRQRFQTTYLELFDTVTSILGYEPDEAAFQQTTTRIRDELEAYDHLYDIYNEYPEMVNLCTVNLHPGETLEVDQKIIDLLLFCQEASEFSGGKTDAMLGAVLRLWHEARETSINDPEQAYIPDMAALKAAKEHTGFQYLEIDPEKRTVRLTDPEARLDVGAIAKGYATQRVSETLPEGYLLSVGGNVVATGPKPDGSAWTVGVQNPADPSNGYLHRLSLTKGAVVTSGDYQRYFTVGDQNYHHIIDPETLMPGEKWRGVTVITEDSGLADALSTSLFLMTQEEGQKLLDQFGAVAMWVDKDGVQTYSEGYLDYVK